MNTFRTRRIVESAPDHASSPSPRLMEVLDELRSRNSEEFAGSLEERKKLEREFANFIRDDGTTEGLGSTCRAELSWTTPAATAE